MKVESSNFIKLELFSQNDYKVLFSISETLSNGHEWLGNRFMKVF